jgi:hypothetical protein
MRKEGVQGKGMEGVGAEFMSINRHFMEHGLGQPQLRIRTLYLNLT